MTDRYGLVTHQVHLHPDLAKLPGTGSLRSMLGGIVSSPLDAWVVALIAGAIFWFVFIVTSPQAAARSSVPLRPSSSAAVPPWSGPGGFPPPHSLGRIMRSVPRPALRPTVHAPWSEERADGRVDVPRRKSLPLRVTHASAAHVAPVERQSTGPSSEVAEPARPSREASLSPGHVARVLKSQRHIAHRSHNDPLKLEHPDHWVVMPGDTLWDIAASHLHTTDDSRIARYWPLIHRENRDVVGSDPSLIRPGQVLELPPEKR